MTAPEEQLLPAVITVQVGTLANRALAQFWNLQLHSSSSKQLYEQQHVTMARVCGSAVGPVPRAAIVDLRTSLRGLRVHSPGGDLGPEGATAPPPQAWSGSVLTVHQQTPSPAETADDGHAAIEDEEWGGMLQCAVHTRSLCTVKDAEAAGDDWAAGDSAATGEEDGAVELAAEAVREWAETLDRVTGFHCAVDAMSAWGAVGVRVLERLCDDYERAPRFVFACTAEPEHPTARFSMCSALSVHGLLPLSSLLVPLHSSSSIANISLLSCAIDCATLPHRIKLRGGNGTSCMAETLARLGCRGSASAAALAILTSPSAEALADGNADLLTPLTSLLPGRVTTTDCIRGAVVQFARGSQEPLRWLPRRCDLNVSHCFGVPDAAVLPRSFPHCPEIVAGSGGDSDVRKSAIAALMQMPPSPAISAYFTDAATTLRDSNVRAVYGLLQSRSLSTASEVADELQSVAETFSSS